jgi:hypothetical protein
MSLRLSDIAKRLFRRYSKPAQPRGVRLGVENLEDRSVPATVTISTIANAAEGGSAGSARVTRDGSTSSPLTVNIQVGGTATPGSDFYYITSYVTIPANSATADITVSPIDDSSIESTETVTLTIQSGGYTIGSPSSATVNITDNDTPVVTVALLNDAVEGVSNGAFRFTRTGNTSQSLTATYAVSGSATGGTDYTALSGSVTFAANSATADVSVAPIDNSTPEYDASVVVTIQTGSGYIVGTSDWDTVIIRDDDTPKVMIEKVYDALEGSWSG